MTDNNNNNIKNSSTKKHINEESDKHKKNQNFFNDYKITLITNSVLLVIIGYLLSIILRKPVYSDCGDYFRNGFRDDGIYEITPIRNKDLRFNVHCNMSAGGWTTIFKRTDKSKVDFQNPISKYKIGFGDLNGDHFLGLDYVNILTREKDRQLMSSMNESLHRYEHFRVLNEYYHYKLILDSEIDKPFEGSTLLRLNNSLFSTIDVDYDLAANSNCSSGWGAGWWFTDCFDHSICMTCMMMHGYKGPRKLNYASLLIK